MDKRSEMSQKQSMSNLLPTVVHLIEGPPDHEGEFDHGKMYKIPDSAYLQKSLTAQLVVILSHLEKVETLQIPLNGITLQRAAELLNKAAEEIHYHYWFVCPPSTPPPEW